MSDTYRNPHIEFPMPVPISTLKPNDALFVQQHSGKTAEEYQAGIEHRVQASRTGRRRSSRSAQK